MPISVLHSYQIMLFVHKCFFGSAMLPKIFYGYFEVNACVHSYSTRSAEMLHMCSISSSFGAKCIKFNYLKGVSFGMTYHVHLQQ